MSLIEPVGRELIVDDSNTIASDTAVAITAFVGLASESEHPEHTGIGTVGVDSSALTVEDQMAVEGLMVVVRTVAKTAGVGIAVVRIAVVMTAVEVTLVEKENCE